MQAGNEIGLVFDLPGADTRAEIEPMCASLAIRKILWRFVLSRRVGLRFLSYAHFPLSFCFFAVRRELRKANREFRLSTTK